MRKVSGEVEGILVHAVEVTEQVVARTQLETRVKERTADLEEAEHRLGCVR
jgi:C4-dicarboxylate-specific signal transduction histidine kinase